jgi:hypothetical protein
VTPHTLPPLPEGWHRFDYRGAARGPHRIVRLPGGNYRAYTLHPDFTSTQRGTYDTLEAATESLETKDIA